MPLFEYEAYGDDGLIVQDSLEAGSRTEALEVLRSQDLTVVYLNTSSKRPIQWNKDKPLSWEDVHLFNTQLSSMVRGGIPLSAGIKNLIIDMNRPRLKSSLQQLAQDMEAGNSLSDALERQGDTFPYVLVAMLRGGERSGNLPAVLHLCCQHSQRMTKLKQDLKSAMAYPLFTFVIGMGVLAYILLRVAPSFMQVFSEFDAELPLLTKSFLSFANLLGSSILWFSLFILVILTMLSGVLFQKFMPKVKSRIIEWTINRFPGIARVFYKISLARFLQTLATLQRANVPIVESLQLSGASSGNLKLQRVAADLARQQKNGSYLSKAMSESNFFSHHMCWLVSVGEEHNDIENSLESIAEVLEQEAEGLEKIILTLLAPFLICLIGLVFLFVILALYLPILTAGDFIFG